MEGKSRARAETDPAGGVRVTTHQHGHRKPAQRPSGAILHGGRIAYKADRPSHPRAMAGRRAVSVARRSVVAAPSRARHTRGSPRRTQPAAKDDFRPLHLLRRNPLPRGIKAISSAIRPIGSASHVYAQTKPVSLLLRVLIGIDDVAGLIFRRPQDHLVRGVAELGEIVPAHTLKLGEELP